MIIISFQKRRLRGDNIDMFGKASGGRYHIKMNMRYFKYCMNIGIILIYGMILYSCSQNETKINESYFTENNRVYDRDDCVITDTLCAEILRRECMGAVRIAAVDSVICITTSGLPRLFELYNLAGDSLTAIGRRGNGPDDFANTQTNNATFSDSDGFGIWIVDVGNARLKRLNLLKSLQKNQSVVDRSIPIQPMVKFAALSADSLLVQEIMDLTNFRLNIAETADYDNVISDEPLYHVNFGDAFFMAYNSEMSLNPSGTHLVIPMLSINQVNIMNLRDKSRTAVSIGNVEPQHMVMENSLPRWFYYLRISFSENNIIALYKNSPYDHPDDYVPAPYELHILNLDGELMAIIPLDRVIYSISYSQKDKKLYALDAEENICVYNLSETGINI